MGSNSTSQFIAIAIFIIVVGLIAFSVTSRNGTALSRTDNVPSTSVATTNAVAKTSGPIDITLAYITATDKPIVNTLRGMTSSLNGRRIDLMLMTDLSYQTSRYKKEGAPHDILFDTGSDLITRLPYIDPENNSVLGHDKTFLGSYHSSISSSGEAVFVHKRLHLTFSDLTRGLVNWSDAITARLRFTKTTMLHNSTPFVYNNRTYNSASFMQLVPFTIGDKHCVVFNYRFDKTQDIVNSPAAINALIGALNYAKHLAQTHRLDHFVFAGYAHVYSTIWSQLVARIFADTVHVSPQAKDGFYTYNSRENGIFTPDLVLVSKTLAPHGLRFGLREPTFTTSIHHYAIIVEIFSNVGSSNSNSFDEETNDIIYQQRRWIAAWRITKLEPSGVQLIRYNFTHRAQYTPYEKILRIGQLGKVIDHITDESLI